MSSNRIQDFAKIGTVEVANFVDALKENAMPQGTFDSISACGFIGDVSHATSGVKIPENLQVVFDEAGPENTARISRAILDGVSVYEQQHGCTAPADVIEQALHLAYATTDKARRAFSLDSATSSHHDTHALQPNRAITAILSAMGEAIPFAHYLPADIGSNKAVLGIMSHNAGNTFGGYKQEGLMDGALSGESYISSSRTCQCKIVESAMTGQLTTLQGEDEEVCDKSGDPIPLLRGRSIVYVNGIPVAAEVSQAGSGLSPVSGTARISGSSYVIGGTINTDTGEIALTSNPALPELTPCIVEGFIDYERAYSLVPSISTSVTMYDLFAKPWRVNTHQSIDARTQISNELGLDPFSESVIAIQAQFANERHYEVLKKAKRISMGNQTTFDFSWGKQGLAKTRDQVWQDFATPLGYLSQQMAVDTMDHGITHLYVGRNVAAQMLSLPTALFSPSGTRAKPFIFRLGRLFGLYEVYYSPKVVEEVDSKSAQILCIGQATNVTRNPFVLGDAVPPTVIPLAVGGDLRTGAGFYARNFTAVNPHPQSAAGCAMITVTNLV
jgi:hypothetical protein